MANSQNLGPGLQRRWTLPGGGVEGATLKDALAILQQELQQEMEHESGVPHVFVVLGASVIIIP